MRVQFDETPTLRPYHADSGVQPMVHARRSWRIFGTEIGIFDSGQDPPFAALPVQRKRPLHEEQMIPAKSQRACPLLTRGHPPASMV